MARFSNEFSKIEPEYDNEIKCALISIKVLVFKRDILNERDVLLRLAFSITLGGRY